MKKNIAVITGGEASERGIGNLTWIVDYNRQCLDGHRILNEDAMF